ncbi:exopolysaccharide biosynthesis protein [Epibacterium sp. SM1969]|uniref:Exopolysaccharide biosynthesis protein n=1 Tax=Tritonibacter aquimaris TaxID=2663379 RepID=A0A844B423_9RHOB|nr:CpsD/CapB family tyrosine-protein kinase [Tritonibacter aquimaris]MQY44126.1 exopolysaccharide biosynthesis protein [Tritonibacter aquimaris]
MERLQVAIEKARALRGQTNPVRERGTVAEMDEAPELGPVAEAWEALTPLTLNNRSLTRNRVRTMDQGSESAPFDLLRTRMLQLCKQNSWRRVAIVSPHAACGKSTTALNLAFSLARQQDLHSLVFDFDMRRAGLTKMLEQTVAHDISAVLEGSVSFAEQGLRYGDNVGFGLGGSSKVKNPSEILQSQQTKAVLDEIEASYQPDLMLFDMPPLLASDDNFGFLQNVDCALIMVAAEETRMSQIDLAERQVAELTNVMGVVLNKCRHTAHSQHAYDYNYYY